MVTEHNNTLTTRQRMIVAKSLGQVMDTRLALIPFQDISPTVARVNKLLEEAAMLLSLVNYINR